jgi:hypothetical protein
VFWVAVKVLLGRQQSFYLKVGFLACGVFMPYCVKCGTKIESSDKFCPVCGASVPKFTSEEYTESGGNVTRRVKELLHEGNVTRIIVKDEAGKTLLEIPATVGLVGVVAAPWLAALGVIAALVTNCRIVVERRE